MKVRVIFREHGRFAKRNPRRKQTLEVRQIESDGRQILLESQVGRFSQKRTDEIRRTTERRTEASKAIILLERPYVPKAEKIELLSPDTGIFKVTIRSAKTRTTLHIRKEGNRWATLGRIRG